MMLSVAAAMVGYLAYSQNAWYTAIVDNTYSLEK
jgi:hypothetical protein